MILVVDDHSDTRSALLRLLGYEGYHALAAPSGPEALAMLENATPSLIVLDYDMHGMNGLQFLNEMRKSERLRAIPIIIFSAERDELTRKTALDAGIDAYIHKGSLDWAELRREVLRLAGPAKLQSKWPDVCDPRDRDTA